MSNSNHIASVVRPMDLTRTAAAIASNYGDKGAIVITIGEEGTRVGVYGLDPRDLQNALRIATYQTGGKTFT